MYKYSKVVLFPGKMGSLLHTWGSGSLTLRDEIQELLALTRGDKAALWVTVRGSLEHC